MRKGLAALAATVMVLAVAAPAGADEPIACKVVNGAWAKVSGHDDPFMYCIDDPHPNPLDLDGGS